jgi:hypothetical protein
MSQVHLASRAAPFPLDALVWTTSWARVQGLLGEMERDGRITAEMRLAGDRFHDLFVPAALDPRPIRRESRRSIIAVASAGSPEARCGKSRQIGSFPHPWAFFGASEFLTYLLTIRYGLREGRLQHPLAAARAFIR